MPSAYDEQRKRDGVSQASVNSARSATHDAKPVDERRIGIVGSRKFQDLDLVEIYIIKIAQKYPEATIVTGYDVEKDTPLGVDKRAYQAACDYDLKYDLFPADWTSDLGKRSGFARNWEMVRSCGIVVAFWDMTSHGTAHDILVARFYELPLYVYNALNQLVDEQTLMQCVELTGVALMRDLEHAGTWRYNETIEPQTKGRT